MQNSRMIKKYTDQDFIPKINSLTKISQDKNKSANRRNEIIMHKLIMTTTKNLLILQVFLVKLIFGTTTKNNKKTNQPIANTKNNNDNNNKPTTNRQYRIKNPKINPKEEIFRAHPLIFLQSKL